MHWFKKHLRNVGVAYVSILFLLMCLTLIPLSAASAHEGTSGVATLGMVIVQATPTEDATVTALSKDQLTQEVAQQQHTWDNWLWSNAATILSSFLSTLVIVIGALFGLWRWHRERRDAQDKELKDRQTERDKRAEERFQSVVTGLGDEKEGARVGAAILLRTFLCSSYEQFYIQTFDLAVANLRLLKIPDPSAELPISPSLTTLHRALVVVFKEAFPLARRVCQGGPQSLDATEVQLNCAYLREADLEQAWMPQASLRNTTLFRANLNGANLRRVDLSKAQLNGAKLNGADLWQAKLNGADLWEVDLRGVDLRMADLSKAKLDRADFRGADLRGADLNGADLSEANLSKTILGAVHLEEALSLKGTDLRGVKGLTEEQLAACKAKGAIIDEDSATSASQSTAALPSPPQSNDAQASSAPPAQGSTLPSDLDGSNTAFSQQEPES